VQAPATSFEAGQVPEFERRFRAVLAADVVGYTRLMEAAELETHARFRALRVDIIDPAIVSYRGELVKNTGDGFVAVFESPLDAMRCATELQDELTVQEMQRAPERRIAFRMGVNWEPVWFDLGDVYGRGVNTAARLQSVAAPGGIVVSSALIDALGDGHNLIFDDLGELYLKNLSRPVRGFAISLASTKRRVKSSVYRKTPKNARIPSIAVLPLRNLSSNDRENYWAEGLVEDIIVSLSNIPEILVVSRGSTLAFRQRDIDLDEVGRKLGVEYLLSGSVRRAAGRLRLSVELLSLKSASVLWADKYDLRISEVFDVQDEIATKIVTKIATHVRISQINRALRKKPKSLNAYDYLLQALELLYKLDFDSFTKSRALLEAAAEEDPAYATPFAFSAHWHMINIAEGWSINTATDAGEVMRLTSCAIERDPSNALALALRGHAKGMFFKDYDAAKDLVDRAVATSPSNAWAWVFSSGPYGFIGHTQSAIERAERAIRLSPLDLQAFFNFCLLGQNHYLNGTFEESIRWSRKSLDLNGRFGNAVRVLAASLIAVGRNSEAEKIAEYHRKILPLFTIAEYAARCPFLEPQASLYVDRLKMAGLPP